MRRPDVSPTPPLTSMRRSESTQQPTKVTPATFTPTPTLKKLETPKFVLPVVPPVEPNPPLQIVHPNPASKSDPIIKLADEPTQKAEVKAPSKADAPLKFNPSKPETDVTTK